MADEAVERPPQAYLGHGQRVCARVDPPRGPAAVAGAVRQPLQGAGGWVGERVAASAGGDFGRVDWSGMGWDGMEVNGMGWKLLGIEYKLMGWDRN